MILYILYISAAIILLFLSLLIFQPSNKQLKKIHHALRNKILKPKFHNRFRIAISLLWWIFGIITIYKIYQFNNFTRLYISLIFILSIYLLNKIDIALFMILLSPIEFTSKLVAKRKKEKGKQKDNSSPKARRIARFKGSTIFLYSVILLSFSFNYIVKVWNYEAIGFFILISITFYLLKSLYDIFRSQKDLLYIADKLESLQKMVDEFNVNKHLKGLADSLISLLNLFLSSNKKDKEESKIEKGISWAKDNIKKLQYISKVGFSVFKTYLTLKLIFIVFSTVIFFIIVNANFLYSITQINIVTTNYVEYSNYLLLSFHIFIGEALNELIINHSLSFLNLYILLTGLFGWLLMVLYIVLFFDIITISLNDFYEAANKSVKKIVTELLGYLERISPSPKQTKFQNLKDIIDNIVNLKVDNVDTIIDNLEKDKPPADKKI